MIEASGDVVSQSDFVRAMKVGATEAKHIADGIRKLQQAYGKPKRSLPAPSTSLDQTIKEAIERYGKPNNTLL